MLKDRIEKLKKELAEVKRLALKEQECPVFVPGRNEDYYRLSAPTGKDGEDIISGYPHTCRASSYIPGPVFRTKEAAEAFAEAFRVMLELRAQPGVVKWCGSGQRRHTLMVGRGEQVVPYLGCDNGTACDADRGLFAPWYATKADAEAAIKAVGEERIIKAIKTLAWIE